jgi:hypothetical protein
MAKLDRILQKIFGSSGGGSEFAEIGSLAAGSASYTKNLDTIQALSQYLSGLFAITASGAEPPRIQDINSLYLLVTSQLKYLFQSGVPEWITTEEYYIGSVCQVAGVLYTSKTGTSGSPNTGHAVSDTTNWKKTLDVGELSGMGANWPATLLADLASGWTSAFAATLAANVAHVMHAGLGSDWQILLEAAANTAVKDNIAASCSGNAATATKSLAVSNAGLIGGSVVPGSAGDSYITIGITSAGTVTGMGIHAGGADLGSGVIQVLYFKYL